MSEAHEASKITMRGAERPRKVAWTHPFLPPLQTLADDAARQIFADITDNCYQAEDMNQLLRLTDNMPLAVDLIAHLADYEGCSSVLNRWKAEKTALLSVGFDRKANLDFSIRLSLSSPRITADSKELLGLLSILPDGLSDFELTQSTLPIPNILASKATLLATSLAYQDGNRRLRLLMPIREHVQHVAPPTYHLTQSLRTYFYSVLQLYCKQGGEQLQPVINQIGSALGNLQEVLRLGLERGDPNLVDTMYCTLSLNSFYRVTGRGHTPLIDYIPPILPQPCDHRLETIVLIEMVLSRMYKTVVDPGTAISEGSYFSDQELDLPRAKQYYDKALKLSKLCCDSSQQCVFLIHFADVYWEAGDYSTAQVYASEARRLSKLSANVYEEAKVLWHQARWFGCLGSFHLSMSYLSKAREILGQCGLSGGSLDYKITAEQAEIHLQKSEYTEARSIYRQIAGTTSSDQNGSAYAFALLNTAVVDTAIGGAEEEVYHNLSNAKKILSSQNYRAGLTLCEIFWTDITFRERKFNLADTKFLKQFHDAWGTNNQIVLLCLERLANINAWQVAELQSRWPVIYLGYAHKSKEKLALHKALVFLGDVLISNGDEDTACSLYMVALKGFNYMDVHYSRAQCMLRLGDLSNKRGKFSIAIAYWKSARPLFERSLQNKDVAQIDSRLAAVEEASQEALTTLAALHPPLQLLDQLSISNRARFDVEEVEEEEEIGTDVAKAIVSIVG